MFYNYKISRLRIHKGSMYDGAPSSLPTRDTKIFYNVPGQYSVSLCLNKSFDKDLTTSQSVSYWLLF